MNSSALNINEKPMKYRVEEVKAFSVIGQETLLAATQRRNIEISSVFWKQFNQNLKKAYLSQFGNWTKYAFTERRNSSLFYTCAIPRKAITPNGFIVKEIPSSKYLVFEHIGVMDRIYDTYGIIYKEILPQSGYSFKQELFLHFEKYDHRFNWNSTSSVIEIWIPVE